MALDKLPSTNKIPGEDFLAGVSFDPLKKLFSDVGSVIGGGLGGIGNLLGGLGAGRSTSFAYSPAGPSEADALGREPSSAGVGAGVLDTAPLSADDIANRATGAALKLNKDDLGVVNQLRASMEQFAPANELNNVNSGQLTSQAVGTQQREVGGVGGGRFT